MNEMYDREEGQTNPYQVRMDQILAAAHVYKDYEVEYEAAPGTQGTQKKKLTLVKLDQDGFVKFIDQDGKTVLIPKSRIYSLKEI
jgi:hypothetical protein